MSKEYKNKHDLLGSIEWEGGLWALIAEYGMQEVENYDVPDSVKDLWAEAADMASELEELFSQIMAELLGEDDDE